MLSAAVPPEVALSIPQQGCACFSQCASSERGWTQAACATLQIQAEKLVLEANGANGTLATCALRPSGIFGEGDVTFWPTVVAKARQGKMKYIIGCGDNLVDFTYVGNVAQAHLQVA